MYMDLHTVSTCIILAHVHVYSSNASIDDNSLSKALKQQHNLSEAKTNELPQVGHIMLLLVSAVYTFPRILGKSLSPA